MGRRVGGASPTHPSPFPARFAGTLSARRPPSIAVAVEVVGPAARQAISTLPGSGSSSATTPCRRPQSTDAAFRASATRLHVAQKSPENQGRGRFGSVAGFVAAAAAQGRLGLNPMDSLRGRVCCARRTRGRPTRLRGRCGAVARVIEGGTTSADPSGAGLRCRRRVDARYRRRDAPG